MTNDFAKIAEAAGKDVASDALKMACTRFEAIARNHTNDPRFATIALAAFKKHMGTATTRRHLRVVRWPTRSNSLDGSRPILHRYWRKRRKRNATRCSNGHVNSLAASLAALTQDQFVLDVAFEEFRRQLGHADLGHADLGQLASE